jgi:hypothetical protein
LPNRASLMQPPRPFASSRRREYRPGLKPIGVEAFFRWTEVQLPLLKQGAPTQMPAGTPIERPAKYPPRLKLIEVEAFFRWTEVQLPLLKQGAPTQMPAGTSIERPAKYPPRLKPIEVEAFFRWTKVQPPLLKQGAPTQMHAGTPIQRPAGTPIERPAKYPPRLKPIGVEAFFRWTKVQPPLLKQGAPTKGHPTRGSLLLPLKLGASSQRHALAPSQRHAARASRPFRRRDPLSLGGR